MMVRKVMILMLDVVSFNLLVTTFFLLTQCTTTHGLRPLINKVQQKWAKIDSRMMMTITIPEHYAPLYKDLSRTQHRNVVHIGADNTTMASIIMSEIKPSSAVKYNNHDNNEVDSVGAVNSMMTSTIISEDFAPEFKSPKAMYNNAVEVGATKAALSPLKTLILSILSGCHIAFGNN